jgi:hypothetical protein
MSEEFLKAFQSQLDNAIPLTEEYFKDITEDELEKRHTVLDKSNMTLEQYNAWRKINNKFVVGDKLLFAIKEKKGIEPKMIEVDGKMFPEINLEVISFPNRLLNEYSILYDIDTSNKSEIPKLVSKLEE